MWFVGSLLFTQADTTNHLESEVFLLMDQCLPMICLPTSLLSEALSFFIIRFLGEEKHERPHSFGCRCKTKREAESKGGNESI